MERTYIIIDLEDITQEMIDECIQQSFEYLRRNLVGDKAILKWEGETPSSLIMLALPEYTNEEILDILNNIENGWIDEVD